MKLASVRSSTPDGELVVVSRDLSHMRRVGEIATTLQAALDGWTRTRPLLEGIFNRLQNGDESGAETFDQKSACSPLPRAYQWLDGRAYASHRHRISNGAPIPEWFYREAGLLQRASDRFLAPTQDIVVSNEAFEIDFEGEVVIVTDEVPAGISVNQAAKHVQLIMLANDVSLRALQRDEAVRAFGTIHGKPAGAFSPVAITPDEVGNHWHDCRLHLPIHCSINGRTFGEPDAGDMVYGFDAQIAYAARTRSLAAGSIIGAGTVSNFHPERGHACIIERRAVEEKLHGKPTTPYLRFGDRIRIEMRDQQGRSIFGAIDQQITPAS
jgi:fumarylacetoacetate (FAA) hydrolase